MCTLCVQIPGEGLRSLLSGRFPLTRIAQARSDLSPSGRGEGRHGDVFDSIISETALERVPLR
jgi:hypothetical protein